MSTDDQAGSDTFVFNTRTADRADHSTDRFVSSDHDGAGSSRFDFDTDDAGTADQYPVLIADHVQMTGVNTHAHSDLLH